MEKRVRKNPLSDDVISIGERIQSIMKKKKMKAIEVAVDAGIETENLRKYIKGKQEMKVSTLIKVAMALEVQIADLLPKIVYSKEASTKKPAPKKVYPNK